MFSFDLAREVVAFVVCCCDGLVYVIADGFGVYCGFVICCV